MNAVRTTGRASSPRHEPVAAGPINTFPPPGTRDACPTEETPSGRRHLWGSHLACRKDGRQGLAVPCRPAENPFASQRLERLAFRAASSPPVALDRRIRALGGRVAIVGPEGSGKTTLLEAIAAALPGRAVLVRLAAGSPRPWRTARRQLPNPVTAEHVVLVDGCEQLGPIGWRLLLLATLSAGGVVATLHRPGRLPTLIECRTDLALLRELVGELAPEDAEELDPALAELFIRHQGNIRECLRELYDVFAGRRQRLNVQTFERSNV